jgi:hypothetical protein
LRRCSGIAVYQLPMTNKQSAIGWGRHHDLSTAEFAALWHSADETAETLFAVWRSREIVARWRRDLEGTAAAQQNLAVLSGSVPQASILLRNVSPRRGVPPIQRLLQHVKFGCILAAPIAALLLTQHVASWAQWILLTSGVSACLWLLSTARRRRLLLMRLRRQAAAARSYEPGINSTVVSPIFLPRMQR